MGLVFFNVGAGMKIILSLAEDEYSVLHDVCKLEKVLYKSRDGSLKEKDFDVYTLKEPHDLTWLIYTLRWTYNVQGLTIFEDPLNYGYHRGEW